MAQKDPNAVAQKWAGNLAGSTESIRAGVQAVTTAPGQAAARQKAAYLARVQARADHWADRVARVTLGEWQDATLTKGIPRIASGAQAAQPKMATFMAEFLPHVERVAQQVRAMPKLSLEDGIARAAAQIRGNASFRRTGS